MMAKEIEEASKWKEINSNTLKSTAASTSLPKSPIATDNKKDEVAFFLIKRLKDK
jgi:hypothetical protein